MDPSEIRNGPEMEALTACAIRLSVRVSKRLWHLRERSCKVQFSVFKKKNPALMLAPQHLHTLALEVPYSTYYTRYVPSSTP